MRDSLGAVLVLNSLFQAVQVTGVRRAFLLFYAGRARAVGPDFVSYDFEDWCDLPPGAGLAVIHTPSRAIRIPRVIQLVHYDRLPSRDVRFTRRNIFYRDKSRCQYCGRVFPQRELNLDHVVPLSKGGSSTWDNVVCACIRCNTRKGSRTPEEASMRLIRAPRKPAGHPILRASWIGPCPEEWRTFLDVAYWNVELSDELVPEAAPSTDPT
ncbi:MAG TPA: HNH endonuclease [Candidatus Polarisedimenticolaceae bacterium]|nr:HNH endonuclease [Candidatus Polarisedimenticolaceae bacterium]